MSAAIEASAWPALWAINLVSSQAAQQLGLFAVLLICFSAGYFIARKEQREKLSPCCSPRPCNIQVSCNDGANLQLPSTQFSATNFRHKLWSSRNANPLPLIFVSLTFSTGVSPHFVLYALSFRRFLLTGLVGKRLEMLSFNGKPSETLLICLLQDLTCLLVQPASQTDCSARVILQRWRTCTHTPPSRD